MKGPNLRQWVGVLKEQLAPFEMLQRERASPLVHISDQVAKAQTSYNQTKVSRFISPYGRKFCVAHPLCPHIHDVIKAVLVMTQENEEYCLLLTNSLSVLALV
ncbi:hypothetical protein CHUAL_003377 [Chamberlinius hualienensis]